MHQRGGLQSLSRCFVGHFVRRLSAEFLVNEWQQPFGGAFALFDGFKDLRDVAHRLRPISEYLIPLAFTVESILRERRARTFEAFGWELLRRVKAEFVAADQPVHCRQDIFRLPD